MSNPHFNFSEEAQKVIIIAQITNHMDIDFDGIRTSVQMGDSIGHIMCPTEYRNSNGDYQRIGDLADALRAFTKIAQDLDTVVKNRQPPTTNQE